MIVTRIIVYDGPDEWVRKTLERALPEGDNQMHQDRKTGQPGIIRVRTLSPEHSKVPLIYQDRLICTNDTNNDTKPPSDAAKCGAPGGI